MVPSGALEIWLLVPSRVLFPIFEVRFLDSLLCEISLASSALPIHADLRDFLQVITYLNTVIFFLFFFDKMSTVEEGLFFLI